MKIKNGSLNHAFITLYLYPSLHTSQTLYISRYLYNSLSLSLSTSPQTLYNSLSLSLYNSLSLSLYNSLSLSLYNSLSLSLQLSLSISLYIPLRLSTTPSLHPKVASLVRIKIFQIFQRSQKYFKCHTTKLLGYKVVSRLRIVSGVFEFFSPQVRRCLMCLVFNLKHEHFVNIAGCICIP